MADETKKTFTRTDVEKMLSPTVETALLEAAVPNDPDHSRRVLRALVHLGVRRLLAQGASPHWAVASVGEALAKELLRFKKQTAGSGVPAGPMALA